MTTTLHVGSYRTSPRPQPSLPRKTPWWRLALWWARGGPRRLRERGAARSTIEVPVADIRLEGARMRLYDEDGNSALLDWTLGPPRGARGRMARTSTETDCPTCCAVAGEPCCPNEH